MTLTNWLTAFARIGLFLLAPVILTPVFAADVKSVQIEGTEFQVTLADGTLIAGNSLVGAKIVMRIPGSEPETIRIDGIGRDPEDAEIFFYDISVQDPATGIWQPFCEPDAEGVRKAFPLRGALMENGEYNPDAMGFSITCTSGAQAKCVRWGYKPWKTKTDTVRMLQLYRSCMRMVRADYCGDGNSATRDGTLIDIYDIAEIQRPEPVSTMEFEAGWDPDGAVCVHHTRIPELLTLWRLVEFCPKLSNRVGDVCNENVAGAIVFNKSRR